MELSGFREGDQGKAAVALITTISGVRTFGKHGPDDVLLSMTLMDASGMLIMMFVVYDDHDDEHDD